MKDSTMRRTDKELLAKVIVIGVVAIITSYALGYLTAANRAADIVREHNEARQQREYQR